MSIEHGHQARNTAPVSDDLLLEALQGILDVLERQEASIARLVELAEGEREREDFLNQALNDGVDPALAATSVKIPADLAELDFVRTPDRRFLIRDNGVLREPTPAEAAVLAQTVSGGDRSERRRRF